MNFYLPFYLFLSIFLSILNSLFKKTNTFKIKFILSKEKLFSQFR